MDPDCAICGSPPNAQCDCEAKGLDIAVRQAEAKMMTSYFSDIRYEPVRFSYSFTTNNLRVLVLPARGFVVTRKITS